VSTTLPQPRTPDPQHAPALRWGVLGTGWIAERFTTALHEGTSQRMALAGSRDAARAETFALRAGVERACGSYREVVESPDIDVVYVATPHNHHLDDALLAIEAGKHVLVEKPLALSADEARQIAVAAAAAGVFAMEALWTVFLPKYDVVRQLVTDGVLGEVETAFLDHGEWFPADHRIFRPDLAGGSLLDLATYTIAVADDLLGPAEVLAADAELTGTGVEGQVSALLRHSSGARAVHHSSILSDTPVRAVLSGRDAMLELAPPFWGPGDLTLTFHDGRPQRIRGERQVRHEALFWQAAEVARCIAEGRTESPLRTLAASVRCLDVLDQIRAVAGLTHPAREGALP
jgi:predicted dehydrogenase